MIIDYMHLSIDFSSALANAGTKTGSGGAEALAEAQAANSDSGYVFLNR